MGQARGRESFLTVSLTPLNSAIWRQAAGLLGRKSYAIDNILRHWQMSAKAVARVMHRFDASAERVYDACA